MSDKNCGGCKFFKPYEDSQRGECKRYPPAFVLRQTVEHDAYGDLVTKLDTYQEQPEISCGDFCGEWQNVP